MEISQSPTPDSQTLLNQIVIEFMREQKRKRRFRWLMRIVMLIIVMVVLFNFIQSFFEESQVKSKSHVGFIDLNGEIGSDGPVTADDFAKSLDAAFKNTNMKAVVIRINSPGGSPVQADYMFNQIRFYQKKNKDVPIYAVCSDICASAAYYVAAAANEIYANPSSMVGSIGVLYNGFGFVDSMQKLGVQRRLYISGKNKGFLDPFSPVDTTQLPLLQTMLDQVHTTFIEKVREGRGNKLVPNDDLFSGLFWTGAQAKTLGLIDGFASAGQLIREKIKLDQVVDYTYKKSMFERFAKNMNSMAIDPENVLSKTANRIKF
jgi:protease-4